MLIEISLQHFFIRAPERPPPLLTLHGPKEWWGERMGPCGSSRLEHPPQAQHGQLQFFLIAVVILTALVILAARSKDSWCSAFALQRRRWADGLI